MGGARLCSCQSGCIDQGDDHCVCVCVCVCGRFEGLAAAVDHHHDGSSSRWGRAQMGRGWGRGHRMHAGLQWAGSALGRRRGTRVLLLAAGAGRVLGRLPTQEVPKCNRPAAAAAGSGFRRLGTPVRAMARRPRGKHGEQEQASNAAGLKGAAVSPCAVSDLIPADHRRAGAARTRPRIGLPPPRLEGQADLGLG